MMHLRTNILFSVSSILFERPRKADLASKVVNKGPGNEDLQQVRARMSGWIQMFILRDHWPVMTRIILVVYITGDVKRNAVVGPVWRPPSTILLPQDGRWLTASSSWSLIPATIYIKKDSFFVHSHQRQSARPN